jgi:rubredoxin
MKQMRCRRCSFVYDETDGLARDQIRPDTAWEEIAESFTCPGCGAPKNQFEELP